MSSDLFGALQSGDRAMASSPISAAQGAELLALIADGTLSGRLGKDVFALMLETGKDAGVIVEERGLKQVSDTGALEAAIAEVMARPMLTAQECADTLVAAALDAGGSDNITVLVLRCH